MDGKDKDKQNSKDDSGSPNYGCRPKEPLTKEALKPLGTFKKRRVYVIKSRYMDPKKSSNVSPATNPRKAVGLTPLPKNRNFRHIETTPRSKSYEMNVPTRRTSLGVKNGASNDETVSTYNKQPTRYISTPTKTNSSSPEFDEMSSIQSTTYSNISFNRNVPLIKKPLVPNSKKIVTARKLEPKISALDVEMVYSRYLQSVLVSLQLKEHLEEGQQEDANNLWNLTMLLEANREKELDLLNRVTFLEERLKTYQALKTQISMISPLVGLLKSFGRKVEEMTRLMEEIKNQLKFKNTVENNPETLANCLSDLSTKLDSLEFINQDVNANLVPVANALNSMAEAGVEQFANLQEMKSNVSKLESLTLDEMSLAVQDIQSQGIPHAV